MLSAISTDSAFGMVLSSSPDSTSVGHLMAARIGRESGRLMMASCWRTKPSTPTSSPMSWTSRCRLASSRHDGGIDPRRADQAGNEQDRHRIVHARLRIGGKNARKGGKAQSRAAEPAVKYAANACE